MKKILIITGVVILALGTAVAIGAMFLNEKKPTPIPNSEKEADDLAYKMLDAINILAYDSTRYVQWTFRDKHHYLWDKKEKKVQIKWEEYRVLLHTQNQTGLVFENGAQIEDQKILDKAWAYFCNDMFWLNAPSKVFDPGTSRSLVNLQDGRKGLMVEYSTGGVSPGDAYVWLLDENYIPTSYKMWVSIIPTGGVEVTWEDWQPIATAALISRTHDMGKMSLAITNVKGGMQLADMGITETPFEQLKK